MAPGIRGCFDEDLAAAADKMGELPAWRLPVLNRAKRPVGVIPLGDVAQKGDGHAGAARGGISEQGRQGPPAMRDPTGAA